MGQDQSIDDITLSSYLNIAFSHTKQIQKEYQLKLMTKQKLYETAMTADQLSSKLKLQEQLRMQEQIQILNQIGLKLTNIKDHSQDIIRKDVTEQSQKYVNSIIKAMEHFSIRPPELKQYLQSLQFQPFDPQFDDRIGAEITQSEVQAFREKIIKDHNSDPENPQQPVQVMIEENNVLDEGDDLKPADD